MLPFAVLGFLSTRFAAAANNECDWLAMKETVSLFHTGWAHHQSCSKSFDVWKSEAQSFQMGADSCACLIQWGAPLLEKYDCEIGDRSLLDWKASCSEKYCITDNPSEFCYCNQDELKNVWKSMGQDVHEVCSDITQEWNDGSHIFTQPTPHSCKCFHMMGNNQGQDLGCKWELNDLSKPWEKSPSMASFAKKCVEKSFEEYEFVDTDDAEEFIMKPANNKRIQPVKNVNDEKDQVSIHDFLLKSAFLLAIVIALSITFYKFCYERNDILTKRRRTMVMVPHADSMDDDPEFGLDSEEACIEMD